VHNEEFGSQCLVRDCTNNRYRDTSACQAHQAEWRNFTKYKTRQTRSGIRRMLQRPGETQPWNPQRRGPNPQHHDDDNEEPPLPSNYFSPARFYCVETICAPCGVVIAWTKFARSESTTNILCFLESVYPTEDSRPDYICIDKACQVSALLSTMEVGMQYGNTQQDLLSILSTILPIVQLIFFAKYIAISVHRSSLQD
jgi:hypothetical protein